MGKRTCLLVVQFFERKDTVGEKCAPVILKKSVISNIPIPHFLLAGSRQLPAGLKDALISTQDISMYI